MRVRLGQVQHDLRPMLVLDLRHECCDLLRDRLPGLSSLKSGLCLRVHLAGHLFHLGRHLRAAGGRSACSRTHVRVDLVDCVREGEVFDGTTARILEAIQRNGSTWKRVRRAAVLAVGDTELAYRICSARFSNPPFCASPRPGVVLDDAK